MDRFDNFVKRGSKHREKCRLDLMLLHEIVKECEFSFGLSTRRTWMYFLNNTNSLCFRKNNRGTNGTAQFRYKGCGSCEGCKFRFTKLVIVLRVCQVLKDDTVLPLFDHYFNEDKRFSKYNMNDWLNIDIETLSKVYFCCSCNYRAVSETGPVLKEIKRYFEKGNCVPMIMDWWFTNTEWNTFNRFIGFGKKTAILVMMGSHSYNNNRAFGIATDWNVVERAVKMDWLCEDYGATEKLKIKPEEVNKILETLFDKDLWLIMNDAIGGLAQYDRIPGMNIIDNTLEKMSEDHRQVIARFRNGNKACDGV